MDTSKTCTNTNNLELRNIYVEGTITSSGNITTLGNISSVGNISTTGNITASGNINTPTTITNTINSTGNLLLSPTGDIRVGKDIIPTTNNVYQVGKNGSRFKNMDSSVYQLPGYSLYSHIDNSSGNVASITGNDTFLPLFPEEPPFDSGSFKIKFPVRGIYQINVKILYDLPSSVPNWVDFKLKENGGSTSNYVRVYTPNSALSSNWETPLIQLQWQCLNTADIVGLFGNRETASPVNFQDIFNVYVQYGSITLLQAFD